MNIVFIINGTIISPSEDADTILRGVNKKIYSECNWRPIHNLDYILKSFVQT